MGDVDVSFLGKHGLRSKIGVVGGRPMLEATEFSIIPIHKGSTAHGMK